MAKTKLQISRRQFLQLSALGAGGVAAAVTTLPNTNPIHTHELTPWYKLGKIHTTYNNCDMCPWRCGVIVHTVNGRVAKIEGNPDDPKSRGMLCARGQAGVSFLYDPDRLQSPMVRTGERGEGKFQEVTWNEALDQSAAKLAAIRDEYGPESVAIWGHTSGDSWFVEYFAQAFGTPNAAKPSASLCTSPREEASKLTLGFPVGGHEPLDWEQIQCVTLIGSHIGEDSRNTIMQDFAQAWERGAKIIVVDPRHSSAAAKADYWLPIKPGTDTALLLAWMNVLITERRYDEAYIAEWAEGLEELSNYIVPFTPEWAAEITDLPAELIRETALVMSDRLPQSAILPGRHVTWYGNDTQRMRAVLMINALLGAYGRPGGIYLNKSPYIESYPHPPFAVSGSAGGCSAEPGAEADELPLGPSGKARPDGARDRFWRGGTAMQELVEPMISADPYPVKGLIIFGVNALHTIPNPERTIEALKKLDFVLVIDVLPMEHVAWADVVLPEATYLERHDDLWAVAHKTPFISMREPAVEPLYDTKPGWWIARELGIRLDLENYFKWETAEEYLNTRLMSIGLNLEKLREQKGIVVQNGKPYLTDYDGKSPFHTPSGKIQLYSHELLEAGFDPLPHYEPVEEPPDGMFRLLYGRHPVHTFAKTQNTPALSAICPENELWLNDERAAELNVQDGDYVWLENQDGSRSGPIKVKATARMRPDSVFMAHGFGQNAPGLSQAHGRGASDARLITRYNIDPISGGAGMRLNFVKVIREA